MNSRRRLIAAAGCVLLLVLLLVPMARALVRSSMTEIDQKQAAIARALEMEKERAALLPYVPVQGVPDIEDIWAIEDARTETDAELVDSMRCSTGEMGYDAESRTFYATLGIENGDEWPEIALSARGAEDVQVVWIDDYSYDWCAEAIREGYRYELLAYTQSQYAYIGVVFTGLPVVTLHAEGEIVMGSDVPGRATVAAAGYEPVDTAMVVHQRGGGYTKVIPKWSYRLEFHSIGFDGKDEKLDTSVLGMEADSDWLLLANAQDNTTVRNKLAWDIWNDWHVDGGIMQMQSEMVELFINNEYVGIYQLMQRVQEEKEIGRAGGDIRTDSVVRIISDCNPSQKPTMVLKDIGINYILEYRYEPRGDDKKLFELAQDYVMLSHKEPERQIDDEEFRRIVLERVDIQSMIDYILFFHACTLRDNIGNNIYIFIMEQEDGRMKYYHAPWDMDTAFWVRPDGENHNSTYWPNLTMALPTRMLDLNIDNCRELLWKTWREKRKTILSNESINNRMMNMEEYINASGAYLRESEKWYGEARKLNLSEMAYYSEMNQNTVGLVMEDMWPIEQDMLFQ